MFAKNPFSKDDPRHDEAVDDLLRVKEHLDLFDSGALDKRPPEEAPVEQHVAYLVGHVVGRFDILACGLSNRVPLTHQKALEYEQALDKLAMVMLTHADSLRLNALPKETIIRELKVQLECRRKYWIGQVLKQVREAKEATRAQRARDAVSPQADANHTLASIESPKGHEINPASQIDHSVVRRHGFEAEMDRHNSIASIVGRHDSYWENGSTRWRNDSNLKSICTDLDQSEIDIPKNWKTAKTPSLTGLRLKGWGDALELGCKKLITDQIRYSLEMVRKKTTSSSREG